MLNYTGCFSVNFMLLSSVVQTLGSAIHQAPVVQKVDNAIDWINLYSQLGCLTFTCTWIVIYLVDSTIANI